MSSNFGRTVLLRRTVLHLFMISKIREFILDLLFPKFCLGCQKEGFYICPQCLAKIEINKFSNCFICGKRTPDNQVCSTCQRKTKLTGLLIASSWENLLLRQIIYEYKYRFIKDLSIPLSELLVIFLNHSGFFTQHLPLDVDFYILIPVPLHKRRLIWRGFNQAELLAKQLNKYLKIPLVNNLIIRSRHTPPQMDINDKSERIKNISDAFQLNPEFNRHNNQPLTCPQVRGKIIILIDDVCTTGSTLEECAKILKPLKPKEIWGLVIARG